MLTDTRKSPCAKAVPLGSRDVTWTEGFWKEVEDTVFQNTVPTLQEMFDRADVSHVVENFRIAAGEETGAFAGTVFGDGDFYKWMESCMYDAVKTGNQDLLEQLDSYIDLIGRAQQPDGYLSTKQIIGEKTHNGTRRMGDINDFEVYNFGHLFTAAALYYRLTGKDSLLAIASRTADYLGRLYEEAERTGNVQTAVCPSHYMGLVELYRATGEKKYLELARQAVRLRDRVAHGLDDNQDRIPLRQQRKIMGHAVRANYLYAGIMDLYLETGDPDYRTVAESTFSDLLRHKIYLTGGCGALYNGASPYGNFFDHQLIHQAYGYAYQLPNVTAYNETCAGVGLVMWAYRMFLADPKAMYFDVIERVVLNNNLAAISLDGRKFFYENMLERKEKLEYKLVWDLHRTAYITSYCCPPNLARSLAEATEYAYALGKGETGNRIYTGLYGASRAQISLPSGAAFVLVQETEYPAEGTISFRFEEVKTDAPFELALRIPVWAAGAVLEIQEGENRRVQKLGEKQAGTYEVVTIFHPAKTKITLTLPMRVRFTVADPMVEEDGGKAAVERGPLVYCMEKADLGDSCDGSLEGLMLLFDNGAGPSRYTKKDITILGKTVPALEGSMLWVRRPLQEALYAEMKPCIREEVPVQLIPYYAWDNRSSREDEDPDADAPMKIWFPVVW